MSIPDPNQVEPHRSSSLIRAAIWVAIGALILAAIVCVVWVFVGSQDGIIGRAFLTILLLVGFAGVSILEAHLSPKRPAWFALTSIVGWIVLLLVGAAMIWMPEQYRFSGLGRFVQFLVIVLIVQLALLHIRLFTKASQRYETTFTQVVAIVTIVLVVALAALLMAPLMLWEFVRFPELYWRFVVAAAILAAVGTTLIPLMNVLFAPKTARPAALQTAPVAAWPTYVDGVTPLPYLPDGSPDWGAYYTGCPSPGAQAVGVPLPAQPSAPSAYEGYPPPPPLPPRP